MLSDNDTAVDGGATSDIFNLGTANTLGQGDVTLVEDTRVNLGVSFVLHLKDWLVDMQ